MRMIRTFMDYLLSDTCIDSEHQRHVYSNIYGKIIYPVAINPLNHHYSHKPKNYDNIFDNNSRYTIIR